MCSFAGRFYCRGRSDRGASTSLQGSACVGTGHGGMRVRRGSVADLGSRWVAGNPWEAGLGSRRGFWALLWRVYDRPSLVRLLPARVAPWLFGRVLGVKGERREP